MYNYIQVISCILFFHHGKLPNLILDKIAFNMFIIAPSSYWRRQWHFKLKAKMFPFFPLDRGAMCMAIIHRLLPLIRDVVVIYIKTFITVQKKNFGY